MDTVSMEAKNSFAFSGALTSRVGVAYLIVLFVAGFITNFIPTGGVNAGTFVLFSLASFLSVIGALYLLNPLPKHIARAALATLAVSALVTLKAALDANPMNQRAQQIVIYFLGAWPILFFIQTKDAKIRERFLKTLAIGLFALCAFGIVQGIFSQSLPLNLFVLRGDAPFGIGEDQFRATGLTGNPIIFSSIVIFASALFMALWLEKRRSRFLIALFCSLLANYLTYTRATLFLLLPVLASVWLLYHRFRLKHVMIAIAGVVLAVAALQYLFLNAAGLFIIQRLQGSNQESVGSTIGHIVTIQNAWDMIAAHPLAGVGIGSQGNSVGPENAIITDGAWWILLLELGVPISMFFLLLLLLGLVPIARFVLRQDSQNRALPIATLAFHAYLFPANFINSGVLGHISFGLYWALLGLSIAGTRLDQMSY